MKITEIKYYSGSIERITKLGLSTLFLETQGIFLNTKVFLKESKDANGAAEVRKMVDEKFIEAGDWEKSATIYLFDQT